MLPLFLLDIREGFINHIKREINCLVYGHTPENIAIIRIAVSYKYVWFAIKLGMQ